MRWMPRTHTVDEEEEIPEAPGGENMHTGTQIHKGVKMFLKHFSLALFGFEAYFVPCERVFARMYVGVPCALCQWRGVLGTFELELTEVVCSHVGAEYHT